MPRGKEISYVNHFRKAGEPREASRRRDAIPQEEYQEINRIILDNFLSSLGYERVKETA